MIVGPLLPLRAGHALATCPHGESNACLFLIGYKMSNPSLNPPSSAGLKPAAAPAAINGSANKSAGNGSGGSPQGLTSDEAGIRLKQFGANATPDTSVHPLRSALSKFWTPVPLMLEAAIVLEVALGKYVEAAVILVLLVFNAALGFFQNP